MPFHAKRSPSQSKRFLSCPGSIIVCATLPVEQQNPTNEAGLIGTCVHKIIEDSLRTGAEPETFRDRIIVLEGENHDAKILKRGAKAPKGADPWFIVDSAMIDGATVMVDYIYDRCFDLDLDTMSRKAIQLETRTNPLPERDDTSGTADVTLDAFPECLEVVDYKNGWNLVDHNDNDQLRSYLLGKVLEAIAKGRRYKRYKITIVQPNAPHDEGRIRSVEYTENELLEYQVTLREGIARNEVAENDKRAPKPDWEELDPKWAEKFLSPGEETCFWCDARTVCPARIAMAKAQAIADFDDLDGPATYVEERTPSTISEAEKILAWAPAMQNLIAAATQWVQRSLEHGKPSTTHKLVRMKTNREWAEEFTPEQLAKNLRKSGLANLEPGDLTTAPALKSGPQVEKLLKADKRKAFSELYLIKPQGRLTLAPITDPRPAVAAGAAVDFDDDLSAGEFD
jgi:hypothetical protein